MAQSLKLKVIECRMETPTVKCIRLALPSEGFSFKPGQYSSVTLTSPSGEDLSHSFSIASSPTRKGFIEFATRKSDSDFKKLLWELKEGDEVGILGPFGDFVFDATVEHIVMLSGGIGITPLRNMLEYACDMKVENKITLLFGNRSPDEIPFKKELDGLAKSYPNITIFHVVSDLPAGIQWDGRTGYVDEKMVRESVLDLEKASFFICGPPRMVEAMQNLLLGMNVPAERIRIENFTGY